MSLKALGLIIGLILIHNGRKIRLEKDLGDWVLGFVDVETGLDYFVFSDVCDEPIRTTIDWLFEEKEAGRLLDPNECSDMNGRRRTFLGLDKVECIRRDPKSARRFRWAFAVMKKGPRTTSDNRYKEFIASRGDLVNDENGSPEPLPTPSSLRRWVRKLKAAKGRRGALVTCAGRLKGQSPLPSLEDRLVHEAGLYLWSAEGLKIVDAGGYYIKMRDHIVNGDDEGAKKRLAAEPVRLETIRARARSLEGAATTEARDGTRRADRMFGSAGHSVPVERFLERVEVDGLELRQIVNFSKEWRVPCGKMKLINVIDSATHFWWFPAIFCGPYREDMTALALMNVMMPPTHLTEAHLAKYPWLAETYGTMNLAAPDNEKAIFSPGSVSALTELGVDFEIPKANHPDSKPLVEVLNRFIKGYLECVAGTVRGPRHPKDPTRNAVDEAEMTRWQLRTQILHAWLDWNTSKRPYLGGRSPLDMVQDSILAGDRPQRHTPGDIRRGLSKTHDNIIVTRDGFEFDGIRYQAPELAGVVDANYHRTGFKDRIDGTAKIIVSIRTNEGNLHEAEVFDAERKRFVTVFSTEPGYTQFLSRWEHAEFKQMMAVQKPRRLAEVEKMRLRAERLRDLATDLPTFKIKTASKTAALLECDEVRRASGARILGADFSNAALHGILATSGCDLRTDVPRPVHVPAPPARKRKANAPADLLEALGGPCSEASCIQALGHEATDIPPSEEFVWPNVADADDDYHDDLDDLDDLVEQEDEA